ncbi:BLOC-3 complex member HPS1-like [Panonychus citri]|uniref:BLOC-3 complex member HPS1-like n=1 Tax=Panonychus citri TaxID=50023 RepID=UPI0023078005|nr:BLOC-3 complex member HPS1-like [Panonychus citri]
MDCLMIFDVNNYLIYVKPNRKFLEGLSSLVFDSKLSDLPSVEKVTQLLVKDSKQLENMIVLIFAPYVAAIRVLGEESPTLDVFQDKYPTVKLIHSQFLDYIFFYVADTTNFHHDKQMEHNLITLVAISKFLFGVALSEIKGDDKQMNLLTSMYNNWLINSSCPVYLVEAMEKLFISQSIQKVFGDLLRSNVIKLSSQTDRFSIEIPSHGLFFVERKLLTRTSSRNATKLNKGDLVLITLLVDTLQRTREYYSEDEDKLKMSFYNKEDEDNQGNRDDDYINDEDEDYEEKVIFQDETRKENESDIIVVDDDGESPKSQKIPLALISESLSSETSSSSSSSSSNSPSPTSYRSDNPHLRPRRVGHSREKKHQYRWKEFDQRLIFLHSSVDQRYLVPFYLRYIRIAEEISLVILSQLPTTLMTFHIHNLLNILNMLQYRPKDLRCSHTLQEFDVSLAKLNRHLNETVNQPSDLIRTLMIKLNQVSKSEIRKHILSRNGMEEISAQLDSLASSVSTILKTVYCEKIYLHHSRLIERFNSDPIVTNFLFSLKNGCSYIFKDYLDYFRVKSQRNMAIEAYLDVVPGLVGFIYVDRNLNELIMAKVDDGDDAIGDFNLLNLNLSINVLPRLVETAYVNLSSKGQLTSTWSENGLSFNYIIWFESENGDILKVPESKSSADLMSYPSMMSFNFVDKLLSSCWPSYRLGPSPTKGGNLLSFELFYVQKLTHVKPGNQIIEARKLARRLWAVTSSSTRNVSIF